MTHTLKEIEGLVREYRKAIVVGQSFDEDDAEQALLSAIRAVVEERDRYKATLEAIMHARRNPNVALTDMSRAGMRELAGAVLQETKCWAPKATLSPPPVGEQK